MEMTNRVAVVTGASRGVGRGMAIELARAGAKVVVAARSETDRSLPGTIHKTVAAIREAGGNATALRVDLADHDDVVRCMDRVLSDLGRIDILVNNSVTLGKFYQFPEMPMENWDYVMAVNFRAPLLICKLVVPAMLDQGEGVIVNVTSGAAALAAASADTSPMPYGVSKAALDRFTAGLAHELDGRNIAVVTLDPTFTWTERLDALGKDVGLDIRNAQPNDYPGRALVHLLDQGPMGLHGNVLRVPDYVDAHGLG